MFSRLEFVVAGAVFFLISLSLLGCSGSEANLAAFKDPAIGNNGDTKSFEGGFPDNHNAMPKTQTMDNILKELDSLEVPDGVDFRLLDELKTEFLQILTARGLSSITSSLPSGNGNKVTSLDVFRPDHDFPRNYSARWDYLNVGDYDRNSEVGISDITPIAVFFMSNVDSDNWSEARWADGDANGEVNLSDISPIAVNYAAAIDSYKIEGALNEGGPWNLVVSANKSDLQTGGLFPAELVVPMPGEVGYSYYRVLPLDSGLSPGLESNLSPILKTQDNVVIVGNDNDLTYVAFNENNGKYIFESDEPGLFQMKENDVIMWNDEDGNGTILKLNEDSQINGSYIEFTAEEAGLLSVIQDGFLETKITMEDAEITYDLANSPKGASDILDPLEKDLSGLVLYRYPDEDPPGSNDPPANVVVELETGLVRFTPELDIFADYGFVPGNTFPYIPVPGLISFNAVASGELFLDFDIKATVDYEDSYTDEFLIKELSKPFLVPICGVPIAGRAFLRLYAGVEGRGQLHGEAGGGFDYTYQTSAGVRWDQTNGWQEVFEQEDEFNEHPIYIYCEGDAYVKAWIRPELEIVIYESLYTSIDFKPYADIKGQFWLTPSPPTLTWYSTAGIQSYAHAKLEVFEYVLFDKTVTLADTTAIPPYPFPPYVLSEGSLKWIEAGFSATPQSGNAPLAVSFTNQSTCLVPPNTFSSKWDFDNDGTWDSTESDPEHQYISAGTYTCELSVTDTFGVTDQTTRQVEVSDQPFYTVTGHVEDELGTGINDVQVNITGDSTTNATTNSNGDWSIELADGSYTATPNLDPWLFTPNNAGFSISGSSYQLATFAGVIPGPFKAYGWVYENDGSTPLPSVTVTITGDGSGSDNTDASGYWEVYLSNGNYTATPSKAGWTFNPMNRNFTLMNADVLVGDFLGSTLPPITYMASGYVYEDDGTTPLPDVTMGFTGSHGSVQTNSLGRWERGGLTNGTYTVTPTKATWAFTPTSREFNIDGSDTPVSDFIANSVLTYLAFGYVYESDGTTPLDLVNINFTAGHGTVQTDGSGYWERDGLPNGSYSATPSKSGWTFDPASRNFSIADGNTQVSEFLGTETGGGSDWVHTWGGAGTDWARPVIVDAAGNSIVTGLTSSSGEGGDDALIAKYSSAGTLQWVKSWGGPGHEYLRSLALDSSGNIYAAGETDSFGQGGSDILIIKFSPTGSVVWAKTWGDTLTDASSFIVMDSVGDLVVSGHTRIPPDNDEFAILKIDQSGSMVYQKKWGTGTDDITAGRSVIDASNNLYVTGRTTNNPHVGAIVKVSSTGTLVWQKTFNGQGTGVELAGGYVYVSALTDFSIDFVKSGLLQLDSSGNLNWFTTWETGDWAECRPVIADSSGDIYIGGHNYNDPILDMFLLKFNSAGQGIWQKTWDSGGDDVLLGLDINPDGKLIYCGYGMDNSGSWVNASGTFASSSHTLSNASGSMTNATGTLADAPGVLSTPTGTEDTGGGGNDLLIGKITL